MKQLRSYLWMPTGFVALIVYLPLLVVAVLSFNRSRFGVKWTGFTTDWYSKLFANEQVHSALAVSVTLAFSTALIATVLGTGWAYGLRAKRRKEHWSQSLMYVPIVVPDILLAIALFLFFSVCRQQFGLFELGLPTMMVAHITFQLPFVALIIRSRLSRLDPSIEDAARDLGATPRQTFFRVMLPQLMPGILAAFLLSVTLSLDDFVISFFSSGPGSTTLPILIYSSVRRGVTPEIHALSTLMVLFSALVTILATLLTNRRGMQAR
jgi:spermidine/putrescine transport system permease protein